MAKEIIKKKNVFKRVLLFASIGIAVGAIAVGAFASFAINPMLSILEFSILGLGAGAVVGAGIGLATAGSAINTRRHKRIVKKSMAQIKELDKDKSDKVSQKQRVKVCKRYAKSSLHLAKKQGISMYGEFLSTSNLAEDKDTQRLNEMDAFEILSALSKGGAKKRYSNKKNNLNSRLSSGRNGFKPSNRTWTQTFNEAVDGVHIFNRRNEISCMTEEAVHKFSSLVEASNSSDSKIVANVMLKAHGARPTYANVEDLSMIDSAKKILFKDLADGLRSSSKEEYFPVSVEVKEYDLKSMDVKSDTTYTIESYAELKSKIGEASRNA